MWDWREAAQEWVAKVDPLIKKEALYNTHFPKKAGRPIAGAQPLQGCSVFAQAVLVSKDIAVFWEIPTHTPGRVQCLRTSPFKEVKLPSLNGRWL